MLSCCPLFVTNLICSWLQVHKWQNSRDRKKPPFVSLFLFLYSVIPLYGSVCSHLNRTFSMDLVSGLCNISLQTSTLKNCCSVPVLKDIFFIQGFPLSWRRCKPGLKKKQNQNSFTGLCFSNLKIINSFYPCCQS